MRIAMFSVHTSPVAALGGKETGGMNVYVRELSRELGKRGILVDMYTRKQDPELPTVAAVWPNVRIINIPAGPEQPYPKGQVYDHLPEFAQRVRDFIQQERISYDLFHSHYWMSAWVAHELQQPWDVPIVHMFHTLGKMKDAVARSEAEKEVSIRSAVEAEIVQYVDRIICATPLDRQQTVELYQANPDKITVLPCGVDREMFHPIPQEKAKELVGGPVVGSKMILFVGRLDPVKGLDTLLKAMCDVTRRTTPEEAKRYCLVVVGGDAESAAGYLEDANCLDDIKSKYDLPDLVMFLGARDQEHLAHYYSAAEMVVIPSRYESFGMVALEAMACGTPVIASRVGGLIYTIQDGETGFLVPDQDPEALADKMELLLDDPALRNHLGQQALASTIPYSWGNIANQILMLYEEMLKG